jgi:chemotaxis protein methyltransferase CheR
MKSADFELYEKMLYKESGLVITPEKSYLLESRLSPVARKWDCNGLEPLTEKLRALGCDPALKKDVIEAMTTNETSFFRDNKPFDNFKNVALPHIVKSKPMGSPLKIWCAACSSGQEPYSLAMILKEHEGKLNNLRPEIYATDLSEEILEKARVGKYSQFEVQRGMPINLLVKYFKQDGETWTINDNIKNMVKFETNNMLKPFIMPGKFDIILCRNVLIYFDQETKSNVLDRLSDKIENHGFLMLGGAETVLGLTDRFKPLQGHRGLYVPSNSNFDA